MSKGRQNGNGRSLTQVSGSDGLQSYCFHCSSTKDQLTGSHVEGLVMKRVANCDEVKGQRWALIRR